MLHRAPGFSVCWGTFACKREYSLHMNLNCKHIYPAKIYMCKIANVKEMFKPVVSYSAPQR